MTELALARGGNDLIKTRREYIPVGSDRSIHAAHGLVRSLPPLADALQQLTLFQVECLCAQLCSLLAEVKYDENMTAC